MEEGTSKSTEELAEDLLLLNGKLREALEQEDFDSITPLVNERGLLVTSLMKAHQTDPLPKPIGKKVLDQEAELQTQMEAAQEFLGSELSRSQKRAHAKRMYKKFEV